MNKFSPLFIIFALVCTPLFADASPVLRGGESVSVDASQSLQNDFYALAEKVNISGVAEHDVYIAAATVTINAPVREDVAIVGGVVQIHSEIGDDLRIVGGEVTVGEKVGGDVLVVGGTLHILSTAQIGGDVIFAGERLIVDGNVLGSVHGSSEQLRVNARVEGDIDYTAAKTFSLGDNAEVLGSVSYKSSSELARSHKASVEGDITRHEITVSPSNTFESHALFLLILLFSGLAAYFVGKSYVQSAVTRASKLLGQNGLIGLGMLILTPIVSLVFMVSMIGSVVGTMLVLGYVVLLLAAFILATILLGQHVQKFFTKNSILSIQTVVIGAFSVSIVVLVPVIGPLLVFAATMVMFGSLGRTIFKSIRS